LTACGFQRGPFRLFLPAEAPGLELPGSAEATLSILLLNLPSHLAALFIIIVIYVNIH